MKTWRDFDITPADSPWWSSADLYFVGYDSLRGEVNGFAHYLRGWLRQLDGLPGSALHTRTYKELVLVGHSLGAVVVRKLLLAEYLRGASTDSLLFSPALSTRIAFFSPATAGFQPTRALGIIRATGFWTGIQALLCSSPAYNVLADPARFVLSNLQDATEAAIATDPMQRLAAMSLSADPDGVVVVDQYPSDHPADFAHGKHHTSVCKPKDAYLKPFDFVSDGAAL